jgi:hypothetical protein
MKRHRTAQNAWSQSEIFGWGWERARKKYGLEQAAFCGSINHKPLSVKQSKNNWFIRRRKSGSRSKALWQTNAPTKQTNQHKTTKSKRHVCTATTDRWQVQHDNAWDVGTKIVWDLSTHAKHASKIVMTMIAASHTSKANKIHQSNGYVLNTVWQGGNGILRREEHCETKIMGQ